MAIAKPFALHANTVNKSNSNNFHWRYAYYLASFIPCFTIFFFFHFRKNVAWICVWRHLCDYCQKLKQQNILILISSQKRKTTNVSPYDTRRIDFLSNISAEKTKWKYGKFIKIVEAKLSDKTGLIKLTIFNNIVKIIWKDKGCLLTYLRIGKYDTKEL